MAGEQPESEPGPQPAYELWDLTRNPDLGLAREFYDSILQPSFGPDELMSWTDVESALEPGAVPESSVVLALEAGSRVVVGGVAAEWYRRSRVLLLSYVAVRSDLRGRGIASLLHTALPVWVRERNPMLAVGEVEPPDRVPGCAEHGDPVARLRLFERWRGSVLEMPFLQPRLAPGRRRVPLLLIAFQMEPAACRREGGKVFFPAGALAAFLEEYFTVCEGGQDLAGDQEYGQLQEFLRDTPWIRVTPLRDYQTP